METALAPEAAAEVHYFRTLEEARELAQRLAALCPESEQVELGLVELMFNAVEHGNLGLGFEQKREHLRQKDLHTEVARRLSTPPYSDRSAYVVVDEKADRVVFSVVDQGQGFNWQSFDPSVPYRISIPNGRGIGIARMISFDRLEFLGRGNVVRATVFCRAHS